MGSGIESCLQQERGLIANGAALPCVFLSLEVVICKDTLSPTETPLQTKQLLAKNKVCLESFSAAYTTLARFEMPGLCTFRRGFVYLDNVVVCAF